MIKQFCQGVLTSITGRDFRVVDAGRAHTAVSPPSCAHLDPAPAAHEDLHNLGKNMLGKTKYSAFSNSLCSYLSPRKRWDARQSFHPNHLDLYRKSTSFSIILVSFAKPFFKTLILTTFFSAIKKISI